VVWPFDQLKLKGAVPEPAVASIEPVLVPKQRTSLGVSVTVGLLFTVTVVLAVAVQP
jgi:hypothetical protein